MLTRVRIRNFKRFQDVEVELGNPVVFVGPNNSGKTTALQALALWDVGLKRWMEKRSGKSAPKSRPGVTINRRDLLASPIPQANLLWRDLHTRDVRRDNGAQNTKNVLIEITVFGVDAGEAWSYGFEFDYANSESFYCRPAGAKAGEPIGEVPDAAQELKLAYLPPMSGLLANETLVQPGAINVRLGEGRTAEVLRNLCYWVKDQNLGWEKLSDPIRQLFGVSLEEPVYIAERGEISMSYREQGGPPFDLSSSGRGLQQTLLLLAHLVVNAKSVLLLDEPDAHLETLRQRQTYQLLVDTARESGSQIIAAGHSEVVLNEAADRDVVVAFLGRPHRIDDRGSQLLKSLREIGFEHYYQAEQRGWVLYLEGSTDLAILLEWARLLKHDVQKELESPFVHYIGNDRKKAVSHFQGLKEAKPDLAGVALFDRDREPPGHPEPTMHMWRRREIDSYLCTRETLTAWARGAAEGDQAPLFAAQWGNVMEECIAEIEAALTTMGDPSPWSNTLKVSDRFLPQVFQKFYARLSLPNQMEKSNYHQLAGFVPLDQFDPEIGEVLDLILNVARQARPTGAIVKT